MYIKILIRKKTINIYYKTLYIMYFIYISKYDIKL